MDQVRRRTIGWSLGAVAAGATSWTMALEVRHLLPVLGSPTPVSPRELITLLLATAALVLGGWLALTTAVALTAHLPGRIGQLAGRISAAVAPVAARRAAAFLVGVSLGAAAAPSSGAASDGPPPNTAAAAPARSGAPARVTDLPPAGWAPTTPGATASQAPGGGRSGSSPSVPEPGWTPSRPVVRPQPDAGLLLSAPPAGGRRGVVVLRGDTLWSIAAHALGAGATDAEVAVAWPRWHAANRAVIGPDPDVLLPGQVLYPPGAPR